MENFGLYFTLGQEHILDINGYDHILFVLALAAIYTLKDWRKILILVTAFTVGHSVTLALATLQIIQVNAAVVEFIIPVTIFITALSNLLVKESKTTSKLSLNYGYALFFGLIHGLGFSNYLRAMLGKSQSIVGPLFAFNVGLELGQIIIVALFLIVSFIVINLGKVQHRWWRISISLIITLMSLALLPGRMFWT